MPGFPLTERRTGHWSSALRLALPRLLLGIAVGGLAVLVSSHIKIHLGPGHKVIFWMIPVITARWAFGCWGSGIAGATAAATVSFAVGDGFAGGVLFLPLVLPAGAILDAAVALARNCRWWAAIPLVGLAGAAASVLCMGNRLLTPVHPLRSFWNIPWPSRFLLSYALFGLISGLVGTVLAGIILAARKRSKKNQQSNESA